VKESIANSAPQLDSTARVSSCLRLLLRLLAPSSLVLVVVLVAVVDSLVFLEFGAKGASKGVQVKVSSHPWRSTISPSRGSPLNVSNSVCPATTRVTGLSREAGGAMSLQRHTAVRGVTKLSARGICCTLISVVQLLRHCFLRFGERPIVVASMSLVSSF
jgi:hypothetical protein